MSPAISKVKLFLLVISCQLLLIAASYSPLVAKESAAHKKSKISRKNPSHVKDSKSVTAKAYYYAKSYSGKRTSSGAIEDPHKLTAAHPTLPFGKRIKVTNRANNKYVIVTVNDRCKKRNFEYIDLSREAASRLGFLGKGMARIEWVEAI